MPYLLPEWPVKGDLVIPIEMAPENMTEGMGEAWRNREANKKVLEEQEQGK